MKRDEFEQKFNSLDDASRQQVEALIIGLWFLENMDKRHIYAIMDMVETLKS